MEFKVGDKVKCLNNYHNQFTKDKIYTVRVNSFDDRCLIVEDDLGVPNGWDIKYFELVKEETPQKQASLALPGVLEFMETNNIKDMKMNVDKYEISIKVKE